MKICVVYVYPLNGHQGHFDRAMKFMNTYHGLPPGVDHETIIVSNGAEVNDEMRFMFSELPGLQIIAGDDSAYDISAYQLAARVSTADLMVFLGGNSYIRRAGWLLRVKQSVEKNGDTLYGCTGNTGNMSCSVYPHVRTTGFWMSRKLFNSYPHRITRLDQRYEFEHGRTGLTTWCVAHNRQPWIVAMDGDYHLMNCNTIPNGYHRGDQSNVMIGDRLTCPPFHPYE